MEERGKRKGRQREPDAPVTKEKLLSEAEKDMALYGMLTVRTLDAVREAGFRYDGGIMLSLEYLARQGLIRKGKYPEVYRLSHEEARSRGELGRFRASDREDRYCRLAMDSAIFLQLNDGSLNPGCLNRILEEYGLDRAEWILAHSILERRDSPEVSQTNKEWAASFHVPRNGSIGGSLWLGCVLNCPASAVEAAANMVREERIRQTERTENSRERPRQSIRKRLAAGVPLAADSRNERKVAERDAR